MCGRYTLYSPAGDISELLGAPLSEGGNRERDIEVLQSNITKLRVKAGKAPAN